MALNPQAGTRKTLEINPSNPLHYQDYNITLPFDGNYAFRIPLGSKIWVTRKVNGITLEIPTKIALCEMNLAVGGGVGLTAIGQTANSTVANSNNWSASKRITINNLRADDIVSSDAPLTSFFLDDLEVLKEEYEVWIP